MTGKLVATLMLLCVSQLALGDPLAKEKEAARQKMSALLRAFNEGYTKTCEVFHHRKSYLTPMKNRQVDVGESLLELSLLEVNENAVGAKQAARLIADSPKVNECIETKKEAALDKLRKAFDSYTKTLEVLHKEGYKRKQWLTDRYSDRYSDASTRVTTHTDIARQEIKNTKSKAYLATIIADYERVLTQAIKDVLSLEPVYKTNEINFDRTLQNGPVKAFRGLTRSIVDEFIGTLNKCYALV